MIKRSIISFSSVIKKCGNQKQVYQFARATQGKFQQQKEKMTEKIQIHKQQEAHENFINQKNEFSEQNNVTQNYILNSKNHERLFDDVYNHFKEEMNIINYATCLHQAIKLQTNQNYAQLLEKYEPQITEIVNYLENNIKFMKGFTASNFLSNVVKLNLHTPQLVENISNLIVENNWQFNTTQTSFIIWSLARANIRNELFLKYAANNLMGIRGEIDPKDLSNIFLSLGKLKYIDEELTIYLEAQMYRSSQKFNLNVRILKLIIKMNTFLRFLKMINEFLLFILVYNRNILNHLYLYIKKCINIIFTSYEKYYRKNLEVLDALAGRYMDLGKHLTFRNLSNILVSCSNMNYVNQILLEYVEKQLLRRIKATIIEQNEDAFDDTGASLLEKFYDQSTAYTGEEMDLFNNIIKLNKPSEDIEQQKEQNQEIKREENQNKISTKKQNEEDFDEDEQEVYDDSFEVIDIQTDEKAIRQFQQDYEEQSKYIELKKQQNSEIIENFRIKQHKYEKIQELSPTDATIILLAYCKMKVVKPELFEVLEANFINKLDQAKPKDVTTYSYAHSMLCHELLTQFNDSKKKFLKRSLKNIKQQLITTIFSLNRKYNHYFYEVVLPFVEVNLDKYNCQQLQVIFTSASKPQIKKRSICRQMVSIGIKSIPKLANEKFSNQEEKNIFIYKHFKLLTNFAYAENHRKELVETCYENGIIIDELYRKYSHLLLNNNIKNLSTLQESEDVDLDLTSPLLQKNESQQNELEEKDEESSDSDDLKDIKISIKKALESN